MKNREKRRDRYLKDPLPIRLGGLAATLARVSSSARHATAGEAVTSMLEEGQWMIEWTAADALPETAAELVDIQRSLSLWRRAWPDAQRISVQRTLLSVQAKTWADKVLDFSGLNQDLLLLRDK